MLSPASFRVEQPFIREEKKEKANNNNNNNNKPAPDFSFCCFSYSTSRNCSVAFLSDLQEGRERSSPSLRSCLAGGLARSPVALLHPHPHPLRGARKLVGVHANLQSSPRARCGRMLTVASQPPAATSRHPEPPPAVSVGAAAPCPCQLPRCTPAMQHAEALIAEESRGEGFGVPTLQLRHLPISRERPGCFFSSPSSHFGFPGMHSCQLRCSRPSHPPTRYPEATAPTPPCSCPPPKPLLPWREAKAISGAQVR